MMFLYGEKNMSKLWAWYDDDGNPIRFFDYQAEGASPYPEPPATLPKDHPDWDEPLF